MGALALVLTKQIRLHYSSLAVSSQVCFVDLLVSLHTKTLAKVPAETNRTDNTYWLVYTRSSLIEQTTPADLLIFDSNGTVDNPFFTGKARGFRNAYGSSMLRGEGCTMMKVMDFGSGGRSFTNLHEGCQDSGCLTLSWDFVWVAEPLFPFLGNPRSLRAS
ncbi:unnamed protein product [Symbiodinium pilosum]|uniref:Uncharacterized protein n=1 Tax=Symbiodinium pilosum TaxID=2952 RepID=A0A812YCB7_SYMPI|nr:unnamed protein product [Symbiodinium pilosum]